MKALITLMLAFAMCLAVAQDAAPAPATNNKVVRKIKIRHADPQLIALILSGRVTFATPPEISTVRNSGRP